MSLIACLASVFSRWARLGVALLFAALFGLIAPQANAQGTSFQGWVTEVPSGDTVGVRDEAKRMHIVHLLGVAAPQGLQPYGGRAQAALRDLVFRQVVSVEVKATQGRISYAWLRIQGRDINLAMITQGHAWVDVPNIDTLPAEVRKTYQDAESDARLARIGLWREKDPVPPWDKPPQKSARRH